MEPQKPRTYVLTGICKNSLTGRHKWLDRIGKNKDKPDQCVLCHRLKADVIREENKQTKTQE